MLSEEYRACVSEIHSAEDTLWVFFGSTVLYTRALEIRTSKV